MIGLGRKMKSIAEKSEEVLSVFKSTVASLASINEEAQKILEAAKLLAQNGVTSFTHTIPEGMYHGSVTNRVESMSSNTVYVGAAGARNRPSIKFQIQTQ